MFVIPKKDGGHTPSLQSQTTRPVYAWSSLQNGHVTGSITNDSSKRLHLVSIDLSDAFLHTDLHSESRRFLRLKWKGQVYQYRTIAFGLASSLYVFTKVCRPILEHLRSQDIRISAYLDDWFLVADNKKLALQQSQMVVSLLQQLGWIVNLKKSVLTPTQQLEHVGFVLDTRKMTAALPLEETARYTTIDPASFGQARPSTSSTARAFYFVSYNPFSQCEYLCQNVKECFIQFSQSSLLM
ncbi:hypothetical protein [Parasitella parasitica]|uniref:Reverse transcriptase domain-containing protein n=1 Tax=Parasitella parasitica TaxID=35722 RepID=A0A0B7NDY8_9FUNG|nr:hypothetical protein [Parasitella parasitica]